MAGNLGYTVADLITESLSILGVYAQGETLSAADLQSAFFTLQALVDGWAAQPLTVLQVNTYTFSTVAGQQSYTVGPAGTSNWMTTQLPIGFDRIGMQMGTLELPIEIITLDQWASIALKGFQSSILTQVWIDFGFPAHSLYFWPVPASAIPVVLYIPQQVAQFTATSNVLALPPGYQEALTFELALKLAAKFGAPIPQWLPEAAADAKANIKSTNFEALDVSCDDAIVDTSRRSGGGSINFYLGN